MSDRNLVVSSDGRLVAEFVWNDDRFSHELSVDGKVVAHSVEGDAESDWPPSPPIQQLSMETIKGLEMALGLGAAGRSHWSISAGPCQENPSAIRFDLACRSKEKPEFLGSGYEFKSPLEMQVIDGRSDGPVRITAIPSDGPTTQWSYRLSASP